MLGLPCRAQLFSGCGAGTSHCSGFSCCRAPTLGHTGFYSCSMPAELLQNMYEIFPAQGLNLGLLHWQADSLPLNHIGKPFFAASGFFPCWQPLREWFENVFRLSLSPLVCSLFETVCLEGFGVGVKGEL